MTELTNSNYNCYGNEKTLSSMLFLVILLFTKASCFSGINVGSVLFYQRSSRECWNEDDLAKLRARKIFEKVILPSFPPDKINSKYSRDILKFFKKSLRLVEDDKDPRSTNIQKEALADAIGGHLRSEILPNCRFAYYAGYIPYRGVRQLHDLFNNVKILLNTQGVGWRAPDKIPMQSNLTVGKILIGAGKPFDPCASLIISRHNNNCIRIPVPQVDDEKNPAALALPFKSGGFISLTSPSSDNILLKYYTTAARCILRRSPDECRHTDFVNFNNELWHWMKRYVAPHLMDENLYAAYGGVLRIAAAVQTYGKGLSRRNLYDYDAGPGNKWHLSDYLCNKKYNLDADWSPHLYVILILGAALAICFLHLMYAYLFGRGGGCHCSGRRRPSSSLGRDVNYAKVDTSFPAMLPAHSLPKFGDETPRQRSCSFNRSKCASVGTTRTQRVYDLNENTEKVMSIVMSDNEISEVVSTSTDSEDETAVGNTAVSSIYTRACKEKTPRSPPKIDATMAQLKIERTPQKSPHGERTKQLYSASTVTQSEVTYCGQISDTAWSESYTTDHTGSSGITKPQRTKRSRDLAWARRVVSKQNLHGTTVRSTTGTDLDLQSYNTPTTTRR